MKNFILGFLVSTTIFLSTFTSYVLFCPQAKTLKQQPIINQFIMVPEGQMLPPKPILPKQQNPFLPRDKSNDA